MLFKALVVAAAAVGTAVAQRPSNTSICDYYTTALLKNNTAANQLTLLTLLVNTVVIGNYTEPNDGTMVPGILAEGEVNGTKVNLLPFFSGGLASTNTGEMAGRSVNFLDGGGAEPLKMNMASNNTESRQHRLLTHLYEFFGALVGCTMQGGDDYPAYAGEASMYEVHKFMALSSADVTYFIQQVGLAAKSFGVATEDITVVANALSMTFGQRCSPEAAVIPAQGAQLQAICIDDSCPESADANCGAYEAVVMPAEANSTNTDNSTMNADTTATGTGTVSGSATGTAASASATKSGNSAAVMGVSFAAVAGGFAALFL